MFFLFSFVNYVMVYLENLEYFVFVFVVIGDFKYKCYLFQQMKVFFGEFIEIF